MDVKEQTANYAAVFGQAVRRARECLALPQAALARTAGMERNTLQGLEDGKSVRLDTLVAVLGGLGEAMRAFRTNADLEPLQVSANAAVTEAALDLIERGLSLDLEALLRVTSYYAALIARARTHEVRTARGA